MKKIFLFALIILSLNSYSQSKEFTVSDLKNVINKVEFKFVHRLKDLNKVEIIQFFNSIEMDSNLLQQLNIDAWAYCEWKKVDNLEVYNYYYKKKIDRNTYNKYCKELIALMIIDGVIIQPE